MGPRSTGVTTGGTLPEPSTCKNNVVEMGLNGVRGEGLTVDRGHVSHLVSLPSETHLIFT